MLEHANASSLKLLTEEHPLKDVCHNRFTSYSLPASTVVMLWELLIHTSPKRILEFGSGISTGVFAAYARAMKSNKCSVLSLDHDEKWSQATQENLTLNGLDMYATVVHAPIAPQSFYGELVNAYSVSDELLADAAGDCGFDLCFIDGPPAASVGRLGSFLIAMDYLAPGAVVLLDDAMRPHESMCWLKWRSLTRGDLSQGKVMILPHGVLVGTWQKFRQDRT